MRTLGRFGAIVLVGTLVLAACGGGGDDEAETKSTTTSSTTTTMFTTTTTVAPATIAPTTAPAAQPCMTPEEATMSLHDAWANDADGVPGEDAGRCATQVAIDTLFGGASGPSPTEMFQGCFTEGPLPVCSYSYEGGGVHFTINVADTGYVVETVEFIAD